jgi:hypothetical protein
MINTMTDRRETGRENESEEERSAQMQGGGGKLFGPTLPTDSRVTAEAIATVGYATILH